jgi:hypothetical protein
MTSISIDVCSEDRLESLGSLFEAYHAKPYFYLREIDRAHLNRLFCQKIRANCQDPLARLFVASMAGEVQGFALYRRLPWDSEILGVECARLEYLGGLGNYEVSLRSQRALLGAIVEHCREERIANLHMRASLHDLCTVHALESEGFRLIVAGVRFYFTTRKAIPPVKDFVRVRISGEKDLHELMAIARSVSFPSRFSLDSQFDKGRVGELYARWVENACRGVVQDAVIVAERQGKAIGFVTCGIEHALNEQLPLRLGSFHLGAAHPAVQGRGVVLSCWKGGLQWLADKVQWIETVIAIQNESTARIARKLGGRYGDACADFHRWF